MIEDELTKLLADDLAKADEERRQRAMRLVEHTREIRLQDAFDELNRSNVGTYHDETHGFPELEEKAHPGPPPEFYWDWYAERLISVAELIVEDGWLDDLRKLEADEVYGKIAIGLLLHATKKDVNSLARCLKEAIYWGTDGNRVEYWLGTKIVGKLRGLFQERTIEQVDANECEETPTKESIDLSDSTGMNWQEVRDRLLVIVKSGQKYTSERKLAEPIGCSPNTVGRAIDETPCLQDWASERRRKPRTYEWSDRDNQSIAQDREVGPAEAMEAREEANLILEGLIENVSDQEHQKLVKAVSDRWDDPKALKCWIELNRVNPNHDAD